jgi:hypothetical protein
MKTFEQYAENGIFRIYSCLGSFLIAESFQVTDYNQLKRTNYKCVKLRSEANLNKQMRDFIGAKNAKTNC